MGGMNEKCPAVPTTLADEEVWTANELAALLKIDVKTIYSYVQRGLIPHVRIQSNVRFPKQLIRDWMKRRTFPARP
jgi:excisionase family DNA binding protein